MDVETEVPIPMAGCDHRTICRFEGPQSSSYRLILTQLLEVATEATNRQ